MDTRSVTYDESMALNDILNAIERGCRVLCPECGAELVAALDDEKMGRLKVHRGVYCSKDRKHVSILVDTKAVPGFWEQFEK